jgi:gliding motility-associated-like protein
MRITLFLFILLGEINLFSQDYYSDRLFIKVKGEFKNSFTFDNDQKVTKLFSRTKVIGILPVSKHPLLSSTYEIVFEKEIILDSLILQLLQLEQIEYAEKVPIYKLFFTPNDPLYTTQWNLSKIQADLAWNLSQGCTNVKVAVTDDGFLLTHEDLINQWHINPGEIAGNGIDDDANGYIDDWRGWDAANNDNDPSATAPTNSFFTHGTHVAGIIAGQTHNSKGIAAIGYNCKMIPVKIGLSPNSSLTGAFQGLDYAVNASGCDVINMSWGGGGWSATYQTLFNIAKAKGIICVAAAGNSNTSTPMYPASYNHVISVAASASTDARASFSNFGSTIDVTAPGVGIPSCLAGATNAYGNLSGTSMASPLVAGLCALMKCYNPMPADSIEACLKRTCDNINAQNPSFIGQLGAGRINAFQALQCLTKKPKSDFIALDTFQCIGKSVRYAARSFGIPTLTYSWSFPGGSPASSTLANPLVTYSTNGYKSATLITCNSLGCDTITKTNLVNIDTPKASLIGRKYTSYNSNPVLITIKFTGNPPYSVTLTDGTNTWTQSNIKANPYFLSVVPKKDTSLISISAFSDSLCGGNQNGVDTIHRANLGKDTTICVVLKTSNTGALDLTINYNTNSPSTYVWSDVTGEFTTERWTSSGTPTSADGVLKFNLTSIPGNAIINSATISLYSNNSVANWAGQPTAGTNNAAKLSRITSNWTAPSFPNTYPSFSSTNQVSLAQTPTTNSNHLNIDAKNLIQDIISNGNNGILFHLNTSNFYNCLQMHSWQSSDTSKHPKLVLCYTIPGGGSPSGGGNPQYCENSFKFNGTSNGVVKIDKQNGANWKDLYSTNGFTWECWFNLGNRNGASVTGVESLVGATDAQLCEDIGFHFNWPWSGSGKFNWVVSGQTNCSVPRGVVGTNMTFNANTWYHAVGVMNYATNTMQLYINGNLVNSGTLTIPMSQRMQNNVAVTIGNQDVNFNPYHTLTPFNGKIDEVRFWNSVRTASEIQSSYKSCLPASTANLVAYFKADEGTGNNTVSLVNGNFVGTLQNGASWDTQVDSVKNCTLCSTSLCRDSTEINSAQTGWQALQTNGTWGSLSASSYCAGTFTANSSLFPGVSAANCLWGATVNTGTRTAYNSSSHTTTSTFSGSFPYLKKQFTLPSGSIIDSVRLWMISDDYIDSVWVNNKVVYKATNPIHYGQIVMTGAEINLGNSISPLNEVIVKPGDFGGCYGTYFRMKVYYSKVCGNSTSDCDTAGLILCMSMDGNANDSTKYNHHGVTQGVSLTTGKNGNANSAYYFNGTTSYISLGVKPMLKPSKASISVWVKPHVFNSYIGGNANCILLTKNPNNPGSYMEAYSLYLTNRSGPTKFMTVSTHQPTTNEKWFQSVQNTTLNQWTHLVLTFDMDSLKLYINGQLDNKTFKGFTNVYDALDSIMLGYSANTTNKNYFKGDMDELKMYNRVLSNSEILNLYNKPFTCSCNAVQPPSDCDTTNLNTGKLLHLDFNGNTQDKSGNGYHATNFGASLVADRKGNSNSAYSFNGTSSRMVIPNFPTSTSNNISISVWFKSGSSTQQAYAGLLDHSHTTGTLKNWAIQHSNTNSAIFFDWRNSSTSWAGTINDPVNYDHTKWNHLVVVKKADTLQYYLNCILVFEKKYTSMDNIHKFIADLNIGFVQSNSGPIRYYNGSMDELRIYHRVLTQSEIKALGDCCSTSPPSSDCDTTNLNTGKVLHLDFNGNTQDKSGNSNHATNYGATPVAGKAGVANTAYKFNGTSDYMEIPHSSSLSPTSAITMTAYAYLDAYNPNGGWYCSSLFSKGPDNTNGNYNLRITNQNYYTPDTNNSFIYGNYYNNGYDIVSYLPSFKTAPFIQTKRWYCFVYTYDGDSTRMYIDGILKWKYKSSVNSLLTNSQNLRIGRSFNNSPDQYFFNGVLDDIRIYNRALAPSEVKGYCGTCNVTPPSDCDTADLLACYPFSGNVNDSIGNNHGTVNGANLVTDRYGNSNSAYNFDGVNDDIQINATLGNFNTSDYTISFWMKMNNNDNSIYRFIEKRNICNFHNFWGINITNGQLQLEIDQSNSSNYLTIISKTKINDGNWHQVSFVRKGNDLNVFIDGKFDTVKLGSMIINSDNSFVLKFGTGVCVGLDGTKFFLGQLDDIKIYKRALNTSEVSYLYAKPFTCSCNAVQPPPCDTSRRFTFTQCLNDSIQVIARAGSKYQWSPVSGLSNDTIRNPNVFVSNNQRYLVSYTSLKNCQLIDTIDVDVKAAAIYPKMEDQIICIGDSVQMTIPIYATNIVWSPNAAISSTSSKNPYFFPTSPSTYYLEFRDTFGCLHRDTFAVNTKVCCPARARFTIPKDLLCFGETLPVSNTSKGPITSYSWNFGSAIPNTFSGANPPILTFPSGSSYTLRLIVTNGLCFDTMTKTVSIIQINPNAGKDTNNCLAAFTTQLGESPISDWTYKWMPTQYLNDATIADPICSIVNDSINYILEITDRNSGCKAFDTVVVYTNRTIDSNAQNLRICFGDSVLFNGIYRKTTNNYFYTIKKADGICDSFINLLRLNVLVRQDIPLVPKVRCKFYIDSKGKRFTSSFIERDTIRSKSILNCDSIIYTTPIQIFQTDTSSRNVSGCSPFRYNGKTYLTSKIKADSFIIRGAYSGCDSIIEYIHVTVHPKPTAVITPSIPNPVLYKQTVTLSASGGQTYFWLQTGSNVPDIYYKINDIGPKLFTVRVTDENECWDTVSYLVQGKLPEKCYYGFPNVFSPNEDNLNDEYLPNMDECTEVIIFAIYDRWGEKVFETNQLKGWNGYFKGRPAPKGVYVYYTKLKTPWGIKEHQGSFTLIR